jgi:hypothetical protein
MDATWIVDYLKFYGLPGLLILAFLKGWIVAKPLYDREVLRADSYEKLAQAALSTNAELARVVKP